MPVRAMAISTLQFPSATLAATPAQTTTPPELSLTSGMLESTPALMTPPTWDTLTL